MLELIEGEVTMKRDCLWMDRVKQTKVNILIKESFQFYCRCSSFCKSHFYPTPPSPLPLINVFYFNARSQYAALCKCREGFLVLVSWFPLRPVPQSKGTEFKYLPI